MKIISCNLNGIRSATKKGLSGFIQTQDPNILCFQEVKATLGQFPVEILNAGYHIFTNQAQKPGYSGVVVFSKTKPISVVTTLGLVVFDTEGRYLELEFKDFTLINIYIPHGGRQKQKLDLKLQVFEALFSRIHSLSQKNLIVIGDFNIAHTELDLSRPKQNKSNIMFTPAERAIFDKIFSLGLIDSFRHFNPEGGNYTWWPYAFKAKERNMGWRIDHTFVSTSLKKRLTSAKFFPEQNLSDHCPVQIELTC